MFLGHFSLGNPAIETIRGHVQFSEDSSSIGDAFTVMIPHIPASIDFAELSLFLAPFSEAITQIQLVLENSAIINSFHIATTRLSPFLPTIH